MALYQGAGGLYGGIFKADDPADLPVIFENTLDLRRLPVYSAVDVPMLAICGSGEVKDMKTSLTLLGSNPHCRTMVLSKAGHDFPMRKAEKLNPILREFISGVKAKEKKSRTAE